MCHVLVRAVSASCDPIVQRSNAAAVRARSRFAQQLRCTTTRRATKRVARARSRKKSAYRTAMPMTPDDARAFHAEICVMDLHADTAKLMDKLGYDLAARHERPLPRGANLIGHVDLPRMRDGGVAGQFFSFWTTPLPERGCTRAVVDQLDALDVAMEKHPEQLRWTRTGADVRAAKAAGQIAALGGIEGGQALESELAPIEAFSRRGVRYLGLLHFSKNAIGRPAKGRGSDPSEGLTAFGRDVVRECERCGVIVDLAHINKRGFMDAIELATARICSSSMLRQCSCTPSTPVCETIGGTVASSIASMNPRLLMCARSTITPQRSHSRTTSRPNAVSPSLGSEPRPFAGLPIAFFEKWSRPR